MTTKVPVPAAISSPRGVKPARQIAFIDVAVDHYQYLANSIGSDIDVIILDPLKDGVLQITNTLANRCHISGLHFITPGTEASLQLGAVRLDVNNLWNYAREIRSWETAFSHNADILLYGSQVAAGMAGWLFVRWLHYLSRANVAASAKVTSMIFGSSNWDLEITTGSIQTAIAFPTDVQKKYAAILESQCQR